VKLDRVGCGETGAAVVVGKAAAVFVISLAVLVAAYSEGPRISLGPSLRDNRRS
jgi:hypothetical protein